MRTPGEFAAALFGHELPEGALVASWALRGKRSGWWRTPGALDYLHGREDVFIGAALAGKDYGTAKRLPAKGAIAIPGTWIDVDVNGAPKNNGKTVTDGAPTLEAAVDLARRFLEPTLVVCSGHGLHAWHLFERPWYFHAVDERHAGATLIAQWVTLHRLEARRRGYELDSVGDLARVMRPPGTVNTKADGRVETYTMEADGPRYALAEIAAETAGVVRECPPITSLEDAAIEIAELRMSRDRVPPIDKLEALIHNSPEFHEVWFRERLEFREDQSASDLALAYFAALAAWSDQEIADLIGCHRNWDGKCFRTGRVRGHAGYLAATVARARESVAAHTERVA